ncbi:hypothetical protein Tco_1163884 [Tanacetum coccineum]
MEINECGVESLSGCPEASFAQLPYYCHNLKLTNDGTVTHIETDDEDRFKMVFIAFGVVGETGPSWTWFLSKLKECIGEIPNLTIISNRHAAISSSCEVMCKSYFIDDFKMGINELGTKRTDVYKKLIEAGIESYYQGLVYHVGEVSSWQRPNYLPVVKPPHMDKKPSGRPKSTNSIRSQGEEPVIVRCGRCNGCGHNREGCRETIPYKKAKISARGSSQQAEDYLPQSMLFFSMLLTWMTLESTYLMF